MGPKEEIRENNKIIAKFMGYVYFPKIENETMPGWRKPLKKDAGFKTLLQYNPKSMGVKNQYLCRSHNDLKYYNSFDWLITAVEKVESLECPINGKFGVYINGNNCSIQATNIFQSDDNTCYFNDHYDDNKLKATYNSIVDFIKWYTKTKIESANK